MKRKLTSILLTVACVCSLCIILTGCTDNKANFVGTWQAESIETDTGTIIDPKNQVITYSNGVIVDIQNEVVTFSDGAVANLKEDTYVNADGSESSYGAPSEAWSNLDSAKELLDNNFHFMTLNQDGTGTMNAALPGQALTWTADSATEITITRSIELLGLTNEVKFNLTDGKLIGQMQDTTVTCVKE